MKLSLIQEDGYTQVVLTPENEWEKKALDAIPDSGFTMKRGEYYHCQGGWERQGSGKESLMFIADKI